MRAGRVPGAVVMPAVMCLPERDSHACLRVRLFVWRSCDKTIVETEDQKIEQFWGMIRG